MKQYKKAEAFLKLLQKNSKVYYPHVEETSRQKGDIFFPLAETLLSWAERMLGKDYLNIVLEGYTYIVAEVTKSQFQYEKNRKYPLRSFEEAASITYNERIYMKDYHWGVYAITFAWKHHVEIYDFFCRFFIERLKETSSPEVLDLGAGSGVWHLLLLDKKPEWSVSAVDISETSIKLSREMADNIGKAHTIDHVCGDALTFRGKRLFDAGISCFLIEHLEDPSLLFRNLADNLKPGALAFVTGALTAAEVDHIYEFIKESEVIKLAEDAGFRMIASLSANSGKIPLESYYLPRSMAMVIQKKYGEVW